LAADPAVIDALRLVRLPYHLSALTQTAAVVAIKHARAMLGTVGDIREQRERLASALTELGCTVHPSGSTFLLCAGFGHPEATCETLRAQGILIRHPSLDGHLRRTAGRQEQPTALSEATAARPAPPA